MTAEQKARDMLERMGWDKAQSLTAGEVVEIANLLAQKNAIEVDCSCGTRNHAQIEDGWVRFICTGCNAQVNLDVRASAD